MRMILLQCAAVIGLLWLAWELIAWTVRLVAWLAVALFDGVLILVGFIADRRRNRS